MAAASWMGAMLFGLPPYSSIMASARVSLEQDQARPDKPHPAEDQDASAGKGVAIQRIICGFGHMKTQGTYHQGVGEAT